MAIGTSKLLTGCTAALPVIPDTPTTEVARVAFGTGGHNHNQPAAIFPDTMRWLWRGHTDRTK